MRQNTTVKLIFLLGLGLLLVTLLMGYSIDGDLKRMGLTVYQQQSGTVGLIKFLLFAFGYPLGLLVLFVAAILMSAHSRFQYLRLLLLLVALSLIIVIVPTVFGREHSAGYFGTGGITILILVSLTAWFWGRYRRALSHEMRTAADLKALGYYCFALAAWNICGYAGMPGFAAYPDKLIEFDSLAFSLGQLKVVMAYFVVGWLFTLVGMIRASIVSRCNEH